MEDKLDKLVQKIIVEMTEPGEIHVCPICGGVLHVRFLPYERVDILLLEVNTFCESCEKNMFATYQVEKMPQWIKK